MNKKQIAAAGCTFLGLVASFGAAFIPRLIPREAFWTEAQAEEQSRAATRLHQATFETANARHSDESTADDKALAGQQLAAAKARFNHSRESLARAQFWRQRVPVMVRWCGAGVALLGAVAMLSLRPQS